MAQKEATYALNKLEQIVWRRILGKKTAYRRSSVPDFSVPEYNVNEMKISMKNTEDEVILARNKINECKKIGDKGQQIDCIYETLYNITKAQDITNLTIREIVDDSEDPRWIPIHITDNANAIILGISERKGNPKSIIRRGGYVEEKVNSLDTKWYMLRAKYEWQQKDMPKSQCSATELM